MNNLLSYTEANHTEIKFRVNYRRQDILNFDYFINSARKLHLKQYTIINELNLKE
jgi:hypothetical protein